MNITPRLVSDVRRRLVDELGAARHRDLADAPEALRKARDLLRYRRSQWPAPVGVMDLAWVLALTARRTQGGEPFCADPDVALEAVRRAVESLHRTPPAAVPQDVDDDHEDQAA